MTYDVIIIGAGPAGLTAGIYAARREMKAVILTKDVGGQMMWATEIENYPGFKSIKSSELIAKMSEQVKALGVEIKLAEVKRIEKKGEDFNIRTEGGDFLTNTVIVALGTSPRRLAIPGEEEFSGKGVSYCANCDGPFFKEKTVAVVGGGNSALDAAEMLSKIAKKVYLIHRRDEFRGFEALIKEVNDRNNIECVLDSEVKEILGDKKVEKIKIHNNKEDTDQKLKIDGIFIEIGHIAKTDLVAKLTKRNEKNEIIIDEKGKTKTPGLFAAGDVTNIPFKQIVTAAGEGTIAALAAYQYIQLKEGKDTNNILDRSCKK